MSRKNKNDYNNYMKQYMLSKYYKRRKQVIEKLGNKCSKCGKTSNLQIDHINPILKNFSLSKLWNITEDRF